MKKILLFQKSWLFLIKSNNSDFTLFKHIKIGQFNIRYDCVSYPSCPFREPPLPADYKTMTARNLHPLAPEERNALLKRLKNSFGKWQTEVFAKCY